jgi:hypothetical protein
MAGDLTVWRKDGLAMELDLEPTAQYLFDLFALEQISRDSAIFEKPGLRVELEGFARGISIYLVYYEGRLKQEYPTDPLVFMALLLCIQGFDPNVELEMYAAEGNAGYPDRSTPFSEASSIRDVCDFLRIPKGGSNASKVPPV